MSSLFVKWLVNFCEAIPTGTSNWWLDRSHLSYLSLKLFVALLSPCSIPPMMYPATTPTISATPPPSHIFVARPSPPVLIVPSPPSSRNHFRSTCTRAQIRNLYIPSHLTPIWVPQSNISNCGDLNLISLSDASIQPLWANNFASSHPRVAFLVCFGRFVGTQVSPSHIHVLLDFLPELRCVGVTTYATSCN